MDGEIRLIDTGS